MGGATTAPYSAAKAAVNNLMESYYQALKPYGIGVSVLCPANIKSNIAEAIYTRPKELANTGYNVTDKTIDLLRSIHAQGMEPVELAGCLNRASKMKSLHYPPFPNWEEMMKDNFQRMLDFSSPAGIKKIEAERRKEQRKRPGSRSATDPFCQERRSRFRHGA